jgi:hypothetical protein
MTASFAVLSFALQSSVNLRHAAALALVGWYLMVPPFGLDRSRDPDQPLPKWSIAQSFDTTSECNDTMVGRRKHAQETGNKRMEDALTSAACIATDDPRLKPCPQKVDERWMNY